MVSKIQSFFENNAFGVCTYLGDKLGINSGRIRMYFIYLSFFTAGSPVLLYFILAFIIEHKEYFKPHWLRKEKRSVWELS